MKQLSYSEPEAAMSMSLKIRRTFATGIRLASILLLILPVASIAVAQTSSPKKDIPTIARAAKSAILTIVMASGDKPISRGTGFVVRSDGTVITNYHVIATGNAAVVKFADGAVLPVDGVLATDKYHDLAILKIHGKIFQTLALGNSDQIEVGEEVVAIGNPLGLELTVSNGIVSGIRADEKQERKLLQITAPISHGSSGGPLFNMSGEVVGINAMFLEGGESLNFAIPVNDVKNLLVNRSAQLQELPNEPEAEAPGSDSSAESPAKKELGVAAPSRKTATGNHPDYYYLRSYEHGTYTIEYHGRRLAAKCRETLTWLDGTDKLGSPMTEHQCTYMPGLVGQHIPAALMWREDRELRYRPWLGTDTVQTADILEITAEAPTGSPLQVLSPKTSSEILKTLQWIQNTLIDDEGNTLYPKTDESSEERVNLLPDVNGCQVTFVYATRINWKETYHTRRQVDLRALDPTSLQVNTVSHDTLGPVSLVTVHTTDKVPAVRLTVNDRNWEPAIATLPSTDLLWELPAPYAARFAKALRQSITLCGGKPSSF